MSYARKRPGKSDIYLVRYINWDCFGCELHDGETFVMASIQDVLFHLVDHLIAGHKIPMHTWERVRKEHKAIGDE